MYHIIYNPRSRTGQGRAIWLQVQKKLMQKGVLYCAYQTSCRGDACRIAKRLTGPDWDEKQDVLVVIGGDGTVNETLNGIQKLSRVKFGYIPTGSGNDFARGTGINTDPVKALQVIMEPGKSVLMDIGYTQVGKKRRRFAISSGLGYDAAICHEALSSRIKEALNRMHLGKLTYVIIAVRQLFFSEVVEMEIRVDGMTDRHYDKVLFAVAMNLPYEGGGCMFAPGASCEDGRLDLMVVDGISPWKVLLLLPLALKGKHTGFSEIHMNRGQRIQVIAKKAKAVHLDGESGGYQRKLVWGLEKERLQLLHE